MSMEKMSAQKNGGGKTKRIRCVKNRSTLIHLCKTEPNEDRKDAIISEDPFCKFSYKDQITRHRYEMSSLKKQKTKLKQMPIEKRMSNIELGNFYNEGIDLLQNITEIRKKDLIEEFKQINEKKKKHVKRKSCVTVEEIEKMKKKLRKEVFFINQNFLREYLYHKQPFNHLLLDINTHSNSNIINEKKINDIKEKIHYCMNERKSESKAGMKKITAKTAMESRMLKQKISLNLDKKFSKIWDSFDSLIARKVKMEGEFNWAHRNSEMRS